MRSNNLWKALFLAPILGAPAILAAGCDGGSSSECQSPRTYFEQNVWGPVLSAKCIKCHSPDGIAVAEKGARFVLQPPSYPGFIDANLKMLEDISRIDVDGTPIILVKPIGGANHGGQEVIAENSEEFQALKTLVEKIKNPPGCEDLGPQAIEGVTQLTPGETFRKAAIHLAGRLPTAAEEKSVTSDATLEKALDGLLKEDAFLERMREIYNDSVLTDRWDRGGDGLYLVNKDDFPKIEEIKDGGNYDAERRAIARAVAREPLNLVAYVVQQNKPFSEILTAPYVVANPFNAQVYGVTGFTDPTNENEYKEVELTAYDGTKIPHAGILTTGAFLNRWPTTPTNRSRGRARQVAKSFMAFNVLKISERPVDASKITAVDNPTMNSTACNVCHTYVDPIAGAFRGWSENGNYTKFYNDADWHNDMLPAGFGAEQMPPSNYNNGLQWIAQQIVNDPRFAISTVFTVYTGITGHDPLAYPTDTTAADFKDQLTAWEAQDAFFRNAVYLFSTSKSNVKSVVKAIVMSPYFRGVAATNESKAQLADIGTGHLMTPQMLNRKIHAVTGAHWGYFDNGQRRDMLSKETYQNYFILYGGMDSDSVISHLKQPNGTVAAVATRMANEMACSMTAWDFTKATDKRRFFPLVERTVIPESAGNEVPASVKTIKENIAYLHHLILGENVKVDDPEVARSYKVFLETWRELDTAQTSDLPYWCRGQWDASTGLELPADQQITDDPDHTIRAWMAVMSYLMMDYKFIYE
jgi:hypothetical protein